MTPDQANRTVADAISSAMAHCKSKSVDEQTLRTGLLTITIANFVNGIGRQNAIELFSAIPAQIQAGTFDRYVNEAVEKRAAPPAPVNRGGPVPSHFIPPQSSPVQHPNPPHTGPSEDVLPPSSASSNNSIPKRRMNI
ncbi:hypothetical protein [Sneathiella limimaris]|uniref:hypothetical protein n=1 Tax=Sneathiella limimaris TaxID=1964213 RepID=UPI00146F36A3|nr:hypothetical protein [Sneathiella limimaris]